MKKRIRILGVLLSICVLICSLSSCAPSLLKGFFENIIIEKRTEAPVEESTEPTAPPQDPEPEEPVSDLLYCLTDEDVLAFNELLARCEAAFMDPNSTEEALEQIEDQFSDAYYHIVTQSQLAYIGYCLNTADQERADDYLFSSKAAADAYDGYMQLCKRMDASNSPWKALFFEGWSDADFEEMRGFSEELTQLSQDNDLILVSYRDLSDEQFYEGAAEHYLRLVENNNRIAELNGYENYWEYAAAEVYGRDYGAEELAQMRIYVKTYLVPLCEEAYTAFRAQYGDLSEAEKSFVEAFLVGADYDSFDTDYVGGYLSTFGEDAEAAMIGMLEQENSFFTDSDTAYQGAFTMYLYGLKRPICYFGPGYQSADTVVHEMGHYYSYLLNGNRSVQMDLSEVQSQGNEWLFSAYLNTVLEEDVARAVYAYHLYNALCTVIIGTMVDEFEQYCYEREVSSLEDVDAVMAALKAEYGSEEWLETYVTDMDLYWRYVTVEQSVYYVSYAVSMLAAVQVYSVAELQSYERGMEIYLSLMEPEADSFLDCLEQAGLKTPMDETLYAELEQLI